MDMIEEKKGDCITTAERVLKEFWENGKYYSEDYHSGFDDGVKAVITAIKEDLWKMKK